MTIESVLRALQELGVRIEAHGDRLAYYPKSVVPPELTEAFRQHKPTLLALLRAEYAHPLMGDGRGTTSDEEDQAEHRSAAPTATMLYFDQFTTVDELVEIDWPEPCPKCGSLELWESIGGDWRCLHCEPPETSRRLAMLAEQIRHRAHQLRQESLSTRGSVGVRERNERANRTIGAFAATTRKRIHRPRAGHERQY